MKKKEKKKNYFNRKLRFTGFVLSKKFRGKNLCDVRIEDDIEKINQQLKDDQILINDKQVEFRYIEDEKGTNINNSENNINNELIEENKKLKLENEKLNKRDFVKNELIKRLDNEKQNFNSEMEKLMNDLSGNDFFSHNKKS